MKLINITEPKEKNISIAFGIDLGTTNSLISMLDNNGKIIIFKDKDSNYLIPSIVNYLDNNQIQVGKNQNDKSCTISSIKRLMGKSFQDVKRSDLLFNIADKGDNNIYMKKQDNTYVTPVEVSAEILKKLCQIVKDNSNLDVKKVVITVPAYFDEVARKATKMLHILLILRYYVY